MSGEVRPPSDSQNVPQEAPKTRHESKAPNHLDNPNLGQEFSNPENKNIAVSQEKPGVENMESPGTEKWKSNRLDNPNLGQEISTRKTGGEVAPQQNKGAETGEGLSGDRVTSSKGEANKSNRPDQHDLTRELSPWKAKSGIALHENPQDQSNLNHKSSDTEKKIEKPPEKLPEKPTEPYNRKNHYGNTPDDSDSRVIWEREKNNPNVKEGIKEGKNYVVDHDPPLVKRYYEGDPKMNEEPGYQMSDGDRKTKAKDPNRMHLQEASESHKQGGKMKKYSMEQKKKYNL